MQVGDGMDEAQQEMINEDKFQKEKIQSSFIEKLISNKAAEKPKKVLLLLIFYYNCILFFIFNHS